MEAQLLTEKAHDPASPLPGPPELLPGRPDAIVDLQTDAGVSIVGGNGATPTPRCTRSTSSPSAHPTTRSDREPLRTARTTSSPMPSLSTTTTRSGGRFRLKTPSSASQRPGVLQLVPARDRDPRASRRPRPHGVDGGVRGRDRRLRRGLGQRRDAVGARPHRRPDGRGLQRTQSRRADPRRADRGPLSDRRVRHQWSNLDLAPQLHLDAYGHARLLRPRPGAGGCAGTDGDRARGSASGRRDLRPTHV